MDKFIYFPGGTNTNHLTHRLLWWLHSIEPSRRLREPFIFYGILGLLLSNVDTLVSGETRESVIYWLDNEGDIREYYGIVADELYKDLNEDYDDEDVLGE